MAKKVYGEYFLGLDIGTNSVGWAVTDLSYNLLRFNGKDMWGARLFEEGNPAADRRLQRTARRRTMRKKQRIALLRELIAPEINKIDPNFFVRFDESKYLLEDKRISDAYILFADKNYTDKDYYKQYPTVYYLRSALIHSKEKFDIRLVYLALQQIIKHRGHFLFEGSSFNANESIEKSLEELSLEWYDLLEVDMKPNSVDEVKKVLSNNHLTLMDKKVSFSKIFSPANPQQKKIVELLAGSSVKLATVFDDESLNDVDIKNLSFRDATMDEKRDILEQQLGEDKMHLLNLMKAVYDWGVLAQILNGKRYISDAMVTIHEKHKSDLKLLKKIVRESYADEYDKMFHDVDQKDNYCAYIGADHSQGKKNALKDKRCKKDDFYKNVKGILKDNDDSVALQIINEIEAGTFMPLERSSENSVIPYQLHLSELKMILQNAEEHYPFLREKDAKGLTISEKIISVLTFRIPYYVGPLNDAHKDTGKSHCWIVKKKDGQIRPWNFDDFVDREASAEAFIERMTNNCSYLDGEYVLAKQSILYSKFMVLNEINNLKIDGELIPVELKQSIYNDLFLKYKKVTIKKLKEYLKNHAKITDDSEISGIDMETGIKSSMQSYLDFKTILKDRTDSLLEQIDCIIKWIVIFGESKQILSKKIEKEYGDIFTTDEIKAMCRLKYTAWGRLSKELLTNIYAPDENGEAISIISAMWMTNFNFMELLSDSFRYSQSIKERNQNEVDTEITYDKVKELYVSPVVKRQIWQSLTIVKELRGILGHDPKKVFIEVTRKQDNDKKRKDSRKQRLVELYKAIKNEERDWITELSDRTESDFRRDKLYLYYTQMGRCMYTGEVIENVEDIFDKNKYDIDHIFPQARVKDDSLDNRVLVCRKANEDKLDKYPISDSVRKKMKSHWDMLLDKELISQKKYDRLVRSYGFSDEELAGFISRQIVETSQSVKAVAEMLSESMPSSSIVYVKAHITSDFRKTIKRFKVRELNDFHHAKDAYLNIVTGNVYDTKFTRNPANFINSRDIGNDRQSYNYNLKEMFNQDVKRGNLIAWKAGGESISKVKKVMDSNRVLVTRLSFEKKGQLFDLTLMKKGSGQLPIKSSDKRLSDINKYGGYNKIAGAYYCVVEHTKKKNRVRSLLEVPVHLSAWIGDDKQRLVEHFVDRGVIDPEIIVPKIKMQSILNVDGLWVCLRARTNNQLVLSHMQELIAPNEISDYIKKILKYNERALNKKAELRDGILPIIKTDKITKEENVSLYDFILNKLETTPLRTRLGKVSQDISSGKETFVNLSPERQAQVLVEMLHLTSCDRTLSNLSEIDGATKTGSILISNELTSFSKVELINQSPTGLFMTKKDLLGK